MHITSILSMRRVCYGLLTIIIGGIILACSGPGVVDDELPDTPSPSQGKDTALIDDTLAPDTLRPDTTIITPDTTIIPRDTTHIHPDTTGTHTDNTGTHTNTTVVIPDTAHHDSGSTGADTVKIKYYSVKAARELYNRGISEGISVMGYVVGTVKGQTLNGKKLAGPWGVETNILIADTPSPDGDDPLMPVELRKGSKARAALNLVSNPTLYHKRVIITGNLRTYFRTIGIKGASNYILLEK